MLSRVGLLPPAVLARSLAPALGCVVPRLLRAVSTSPAKGNTVAEMKAAVASTTGCDPAAEWLTGAVKDGAGVTRKLQLDAEQLLEGVKRGADEVTEVSMEVLEKKAMRVMDKGEFEALAATLLAEDVAVKSSDN